MELCEVAFVRKWEGIFESTYFLEKISNKGLKRMEIVPYGWKLGFFFEV